MRCCWAGAPAPKAASQSVAPAAGLPADSGRAGGAAAVRGASAPVGAPGPGPPVCSPRVRGDPGVGSAARATDGVAPLVGAGVRSVPRSLRRTGMICRSRYGSSLPRAREDARASGACGAGCSRAPCGPVGREPDGAPSTGRDPPRGAPERPPAGAPSTGREPAGREPAGRDPAGLEPVGREPVGGPSTGRDPPRVAPAAVPPDAAPPVAPCAGAPVVESSVVGPPVLEAPAVGTPVVGAPRGDPERGPRRLGPAGAPGPAAPAPSRRGGGSCCRSGSAPVPGVSSPVRVRRRRRGSSSVTLPPASPTGWHPRRRPRPAGPGTPQVPGRCLPPSRGRRC